jgi:hypothetical protein
MPVLPGTARTARDPALGRIPGPCLIELWRTPSVATDALPVRRRASAAVGAIEPRSIDPTFRRVSLRRDRAALWGFGK